MYMWMWRFSKVILLSPVLLRRRTKKIFHTHVAFNIDEPIIEDDPISSSDSKEIVLCVEVVKKG